MRKTIFWIFAVIFLLSGCSGGTNPVSPSSDSQKSVPGSLQSLPIIGLTTSDDGSFNATGLMGAYELRIDPVSASAELVSKRIPSIGESWIVSGMGFFTVAPCSSCLRIRSVELTSDSLVKLHFAISHPFDPGDPLLPPSGRNRLDLDIFDLALVVVPIETVPTTYPLIGTNAYTGILADNAGYTTELTSVISDTAAVPYVLVVDDNLSSSNTYNKFGMGVDSFFDVFFDPALPTFQFDLYLTMGYGASAKKAQRLVPTYFNPEFNRKPAWKVIVTPPQGSDPPALGNTWQDNDGTTAYNVKVEVFDWQHGVTTIANPPVNPTDIAFASDVASVSVEIPGMNTTLPTVTTAVSGTGAPADPLVYQVPVANQNNLAAGTYTGLVKVTDSRVPETTPTAIDYLIHTPDGIALSNFQIPEFATYQAFPATVVVGCGPITGSITSPSCPIVDVNNHTSINFVVSASSTMGGDPVVLYEADWDYNGTTFTSDANNTTGIFNSGGPFSVADPCPSHVPHTFKVAFRATDSCIPPNVTIFATCDVTVENCTVPPVGNVIITVNRTDIVAYYAFDTARPWTLSWDAVSGAAEYAIYCDTNPVDGLTNSLAIVGTSATNTYDVPASQLPSNHYVVGNTYIVRSRGAVGDPASEAGDSEPAFITANGCETMATGVNDGEGWVSNCEINDATAYFRPRASTSWTPIAQGLRHYQLSYACGANYSNRWDGIMKQTPTVPNSTVRRFEASGMHWQTYSPSGLLLGTCAAPPSPGYNFTDPSIIEWASADSTPPFDGYNTSSSDIRAYITDVPPSGNCGWISSVYHGYFLYGGDVNIDGDPSDPYVVVEYFKLSTLTTQPYPIFDEISIVIY